MANKVIPYEMYLENLGTLKHKDINKYNGVYVRELKNDDISYVIRFRYQNITRDLVVGKRSSGYSADKAKKYLINIQNTIRNGDDIKKLIKNKDRNASRQILNKSNIENLSLNNLSKIYFHKLNEEALKEQNILKSGKTTKDFIGIKKEESLYNNFWRFWGMSTIPFSKVSIEDFIDYIKYLRNKTKEIIDKETGNRIVVPMYSGKYIYNAIILVKSIISHTNCNYNPLYISAKNESPKDYKNEKNLKEIYKQLLKNNGKNNAPREQSFLTPDEIQMLLKELRKKANHKQGYLMTLIMLTTGMRPNSCLNLKIGDFNFESKEMTVYDFKRKMDYKCLIVKEVEEEIKKFALNRSNSEYLFYSEFTNKQRPLPKIPDYIGNTMDKLFNHNRFGNNRIVPYSLRHTFATNLAKGIENKNGGYDVFPKPLVLISKLLNHANVETTEKNYSHCTIKDSAKSVNEFGTLIFNQN